MSKKTINNRYRVVKKLGKGGMGEVYLVEDSLRDNQKLALKILYRNSVTSAHLEFFKYEFKILTELTHPNLVRVYDYGTTGYGSEGPERQHFFTSDFVDGTDLLRGTRGLELDSLYDIFVQILRGLAYIHSRGLIHHDIKTNNILVTPTSPPKVKIVDFGLVGEGRIQLEKTNTVRGTVSYLAPECIRQKQIDHRIDLYALGITFYYVLARRLPFHSDYANEILRKHLLEEPTPIREFNPRVPVGLEKIVFRLLAKNREKRYLSANQVIEDISRLTQTPFEIETKETTESYILSGKFVGRDRELSYLSQQSEKLLSPALLEKSTKKEDFPPPIHFIRAAAGMGKSRLLKEFKINLQLKQFAYFSGEAIQGLEQAYQPFLNVFRTMVPLILERDEEKSRNLLDRYGSELARLIPEFGPRYNLEPDTTGDERLDKIRRLDFLTYFLLEAARIQPMVIALDGLQWADEETFDLLENVAQNIQLQREGFELQQRWKSSGEEPSLSPLMICGAFREEEVGEGRLVSFLEDQGAKKNLKTLSLEGFKAEQVLEFVQSMLVSSERMKVWAETLARATAGNPYFIEQILLNLVEEKKISREGDHWHIRSRNLASTLPQSLQEVLTIRLCRLEEEEYAILEKLAVHKGEVSLPLFHALTRIPEEKILSLFRILEKKQILHREQKEGELVYDFLHGIMGEKIYQDLSPHLRGKLHFDFGRRLEEYTERTEDRLEELAYHFLNSENPDKAIQYALRAGDKNRHQLFANQEALEYYSRGLATARKHQRKERVQFLFKIGEIYSLLGNLKKARQCYEKIIDDDLASPLDLVRARREIASLLKKRGKAPEALDIYKVCIDELKALDEPIELGRIYFNLAEIYADQGKTSEAKKVLEKALGLLKGEVCQKERAQVLNGLAILASRQSELEEAIGYHEESLALRKALGNKELIAVTEVNLGAVYFQKGQVEEAMRCWKDSLEIRMQQGNRLGIATVYECLAHGFTLKSDFEKAISYHRRSLKITERMGAMRTAAQTYASLALIYNHMARWKEALNYARKSLDIFSQASLKGTLLQSHLALSKIHREIGDFEKALDHGETALEIATSAQKKEGEAWSCIQLSPVLRAQGKWEEAKEKLMRGKEIYKKIENPYSLSSVWLEETLLWLDKGDLKRAEKVMEEMRAILDQLLSKWFLVRYHYTAALLYQALGEPETSLKCLKKSAKLAEIISAREYLWKAYGKMGEVYHNQGDVQKSTRNLVQAMEVIREIWGALPEEFKKIYLEHPERREVKELLDKVVEK